MAHKLSLRKCPICDTSDCEVLHQQPFVLPEGHPLASGYDVVCCEGCGFVFADTTVTQQDYNVFYSEFSKYQDKTTSTGGGDKPWDAVRLKETAARISAHLEDKDSHVIDIGCANGGLLNSLKDQGYNNLYGVDPSRLCVENTKMRGIAATVGTLSSISADIGQYDCILLSHVLEHVIDLRSAISVIAKHLKPEGLAYIEVPDASRYHKFLKSPFQDFNTEHINYFSYQCLSNLFSLNGWLARGCGETEILASEGTPYPVVYGFFGREGPTTGSIHKDNLLKDQINMYIQKSSIILAEIDQKIRSVLTENVEVIVWGTGQLTMKLLAQTVLGKAKIAGFVDSNPVCQGQILWGKRVLPPDCIKSMEDPIIVASILYSKEIEKTIKFKLGLRNKLILL